MPDDGPIRIVAYRKDKAWPEKKKEKKKKCTHFILNLKRNLALQFVIILQKDYLTTNFISIFFHLCFLIFFFSIATNWDGHSMIMRIKNNKG